MLLSDPDCLNPRKVNLKGEEKEKEPVALKKQPHKRSRGYGSEQREIEPGEKPKMKNKGRIGSRGNVLGEMNGWLLRLNSRESPGWRE